MIDELIRRVFTRRDQAHLAHWASKSYSEHEALGSFYEDILDPLDELVENHQGYKGLVKTIKVESFESTNDILGLLKEDVKWIDSNRASISSNIKSLENIIDELTSVYVKTIYKLTNLK